MILPWYDGCIGNPILRKYAIISQRKSLVGVGCALSASVFLAACNSTSSASAPHKAPTPAISVSSISKLLVNQSKLDNQSAVWTPALAKQLYAGTALTNEDLNGEMSVQFGLNHAPKGFKDLYNHLISQSLPTKGSQFPQMMVVETAINTTAPSAKASHPSANENAQILLEERTSAHSTWRITADPQTFVSLLPKLDPLMSTQVNPNSLVMTPNEAVSATTQTFSSWIANTNINYHQAPQYFPQALDYKSSSLGSYEFPSSLQNFIAPTWMYKHQSSSSHFTWTASQTALGAPLSIRVPGGALVFYNAVLNTKLEADPGSGWYEDYTSSIKAKIVTSKVNMQYAVFDPTKVHRSGAKQPSIKVVGVDEMQSQYDEISTSGKVLSS